ncbi:uncharacterized protein LOC109140653 [Larimichthys crocea]|uniref:uncharacterized protein LOC109140653 n=1 Tax=Larimichthys crocea TaxID=215358 RepID=UPI000F5DAF80|nr:uncharacterized protein LOC109140653 [Larimichthys crocea]
MAGHLLLVVLLCFFSEMRTQDLLPPKLTVNPPVITETDSVTLDCQTPSSVSVSQCYFRFVRGGRGKSFPCLQTLTGTELLKLSHQSSPAEVKVTCCYFYVHLSPESDVSSIIIQTLLPPKLTVNPPEITETDSVTLNCQTPSSVSVSQCSFNLGRGNTQVFSCMKTLTGEELLYMSRQSLPAEVKIDCFYAVKVGDIKSPSLHSDTSSIFIHSQTPIMSLQHFPGEYVLFTCSLPGSADHDTTCNLYFGESSRPVNTTTIGTKRNSNNQWFCQFTVTIEDLMRRLRSVQQSDASCDYSSRSKPNPLFPRSDGYSLTGIMEKESSTTTTESTFAVTTVDPTLHESSTESPVTPPDPAPDVTVSSPGDSTFVLSSPVTPSSGTVEEESWMTQTVMTFTMTTGLDADATTPETPAEQTSGLTVSTPHVTTPETPAKQTSVDQTLHESNNKANLSPVTPPKPAPETKKWKWKIWMLVIVVTSFGVIVGVTFVGVTLLCTKRTERYSDQRTQANVTDDVMCMQSLDHGGLLPAGDDEAYSVITSVPGADCPAGSKKLDRQRPQNEDSDIYHVYATIPEEPSPSALNMVYSTVRAH